MAGARAGLVAGVDSSTQATKVVLVDYTGGLLTISADGAKVHEAKLGK